MIATTLGAIPWVAGSGRTPRRAVWAYSSAGGVMIGLSHLLTLEGLERSSFQCILGAVLGATYTYWLQKPSEPAEEETNKSELEAQAQLQPTVLRGSFHSAAEGIAIGAAAATSTTLGMFLAVALAVHNIGEGMVLTHRVSFIEEIPAPRWVLPTLVKLPQLPCAAVIFLGLQTWPHQLPITLGFAAGALFFLTLTDLVPFAYKHGRREWIAFLLSAAVALVILSKEFLL